MTQEQTPAPKAKVLIDAHLSEIDNLYASLVAHLPPNDPGAREKFDQAFARYRKCYNQLGVEVFLLMPNP
jgi:hypothetical protein